MATSDVNLTSIPPRLLPNSKEQSQILINITATMQGEEFGTQSLTSSTQANVEKKKPQKPTSTGEEALTSLVTQMREEEKKFQELTSNAEGLVTHTSKEEQNTQEPSSAVKEKSTTQNEGSNLHASTENRTASVGEQIEISTAVESTFQSSTSTEVTKHLPYSNAVPIETLIDTNVSTGEESTTEEHANTNKTGRTTTEETSATDEEYGNEQITTEINNNDEIETTTGASEESEISVHTQAQSANAESSKAAHVTATIVTNEEVLSKTVLTESSQLSSVWTEALGHDLKQEESKTTSEYFTTGTSQSKEGTTPVESSSLETRTTAPVLSSTESSTGTLVQAEVKGKLESAASEQQTSISENSAITLEGNTTSSLEVSGKGLSGYLSISFEKSVASAAETTFTNAQTVELVTSTISPTERATFAKKVESPSGEVGTTHEEALSENILDKFSHAQTDKQHSQSFGEETSISSIINEQSSEATTSTEEVTNAPQISVSIVESSEVSHEHSEISEAPSKVVESSSSAAETVHEEVVSENIVEHFSHSQSEKPQSEHAEPKTEIHQSGGTRSADTLSTVPKVSAVSTSITENSIASHQHLEATEVPEKKAESTSTEGGTMHEEVLSENIMENFSHQHSESFEHKTSTSSVLAAGQSATLSSSATLSTEEATSGQQTSASEVETAESQASSSPLKGSQVLETAASEIHSQGSSEEILASTAETEISHVFSETGQLTIVSTLSSPSQALETDSIPNVHNEPHSQPFTEENVVTEFGLSSTRVTEITAETFLRASTETSEVPQKKEESTSTEGGTMHEEVLSENILENFSHQHSENTEHKTFTSSVLAAEESATLPSTTTVSTEEATSVQHSSASELETAENQASSSPQEGSQTAETTASEIHSSAGSSEEILVLTSETKISHEFSETGQLTIVSTLSSPSQALERGSTLNVHSELHSQPSSGENAVTESELSGTRETEMTGETSSKASTSEVPQKKTESTWFEGGTMHEEAVSENILENFSHKHSEGSEQNTSISAPLSTQEEGGQTVETAADDIHSSAGSSGEILASTAETKVSHEVSETGQFTSASTSLSPSQSSEMESTPNIHNKLHSQPPSGENAGTESGLGSTTESEITKEISSNASTLNSEMKKEETISTESGTMHEEVLSENIVENFSHQHTESSKYKTFTSPALPAEQSATFLSTTILPKEETTTVQHSSASEVETGESLASSSPEIVETVPSAIHSSVGTSEEIKTSTAEIEISHEVSETRQITIASTLSSPSPSSEIESTRNALSEPHSQPYSGENAAAESGLSSTRESQITVETSPRASTSEVPQKKTGSTSTEGGTIHEEAVSENILENFSHQHSEGLEHKTSASSVLAIEQSAKFPNTTTLYSEEATSIQHSSPSEVETVASSVQSLQHSIPSEPSKESESSSSEAVTIKEEVLNENIVGNISHHHTLYKSGTSAAIVIDLLQTMAPVTVAPDITPHTTEITNEATTFVEEKSGFHSSPTTEDENLEIVASSLQSPQHSETREGPPRQQEASSSMIYTPMEVASTRNMMDMHHTASISVPAITMESTNIPFKEDNVSSSSLSTSEVSTKRLESLPSEADTLQEEAVSENMLEHFSHLSSSRTTLKHSESETALGNLKESVSFETMSTREETTNIHTSSTNTENSKATTHVQLQSSSEAPVSKIVSATTETGTVHEELLSGNNLELLSSHHHPAKTEAEHFSTQEMSPASIVTATTVAGEVVSVLSLHTTEMETSEMHSSLSSSLHTRAPSEMPRKKVTSATTESGTLREELVSEFNLEKYWEHHQSNEVVHHLLHGTSTSSEGNIQQSSKIGKPTINADAEKMKSSGSTTNSETHNEETTHMRHPEISTLRSTTFAATYLTESSTLASSEKSEGMSHNVPSIASSNSHTLTNGLNTEEIKPKLTAASYPLRRTLLTTDLKEPTKHTVATKAEDTVSEEVFDENNLEHFSHHEKSTLCDKCDKTVNVDNSAKVTHASSHNGVEGTFKHTATTQSFSTVSLEMKDENIMEHFSHRQQSTLCASCDENGKTTQLESASKHHNVLTVKSQTSALPPSTTAEEEQVKETTQSESASEPHSALSVESQTSTTTEEHQVKETITGEMHLTESTIEKTPSSAPVTLVSSETSSATAKSATPTALITKGTSESEVSMSSSNQKEVSTSEHISVIESSTEKRETISVTAENEASSSPQEGIQIVETAATSAGTTEEILTSIAETKMSHEAFETEQMTIASTISSPSSSSEMQSTLNAHSEPPLQPSTEEKAATKSGLNEITGEISSIASTLTSLETESTSQLTSLETATGESSSSTSATSESVTTAFSPTSEGISENEASTSHKKEEGVQAESSTEHQTISSEGGGRTSVEEQVSSISHTAAGEETATTVSSSTLEGGAAHQEEAGTSSEPSSEQQQISSEAEGEMKTSTAEGEVSSVSHTTAGEETTTISFLSTLEGGADHHEEVTASSESSTEQQHISSEAEGGLKNSTAEGKVTSITHTLAGEETTTITYSSTLEGGAGHQEEASAYSESSAEPQHISSEVESGLKSSMAEGEVSSISHTAIEEETTTITFSPTLEGGTSHQEEASAFSESSTEQLHISSEVEGEVKSSTAEGGVSSISHTAIGEEPTTISFASTLEGHQEEASASSESSTEQQHISSETEGGLKSSITEGEGSSILHTAVGDESTTISFSSTLESSTEPQHISSEVEGGLKNSIIEGEVSPISHTAGGEETTTISFSSTLEGAAGHQEETSASSESSTEQEHISSEGEGGLKSSTAEGGVSSISHTAVGEEPTTITFASTLEGHQEEASSSSESSTEQHHISSEGQNELKSYAAEGEFSSISHTTAGEEAATVSFSSTLEGGIGLQSEAGAFSKSSLEQHISSEGEGGLKSSTPEAEAPSFPQTAAGEETQTKEATIIEVLVSESKSEGASTETSTEAVQPTSNSLPTETESIPSASSESSSSLEASSEISSISISATSESATLTSISEGISSTETAPFTTHREELSKVVSEHDVVTSEHSTIKSKSSQSEQHISLHSSLEPSHPNQQTEETIEHQTMTRSSLEAASGTNEVSGIDLTKAMTPSTSVRETTEEYNKLKTLTESSTSTSVPTVEMATSTINAEFSSLEEYAKVVTTVNTEQEKEKISTSSVHIEEGTSELKLVSAPVETSNAEFNTTTSVSTEEEVPIEFSSTKETEFLNNLTESTTHKPKSYISTTETTEILTGSKEIELAKPHETSKELSESTSQETVQSNTSQSESTIHLNLGPQSSAPGKEHNFTHQSLGVTLTSSDIHIDLPIYLPNSSETPESFLKFYTSEMHTVVIDDEETDVTMEEEFRHMSVEDFNFVTEFPSTPESMEGARVNHTHPHSKPTISNEGVNNEITSSETQFGVTSQGESALGTSVSSQHTRKPCHKGTSIESLKASTIILPKQEQAPEGGLIIPEDLQSNYIPNACDASDFKGGNGCFCAVDEMLKRLNNAGRDKDLPQKIDSFKCEKFFKVKEGILINNETLEGRVKRSYLFIKHQQEAVVSKRETVPNNEIENVLKGTTNIHNADNTIYAIPGARVIIPCLSGDITETSQNKFSWTSSGGRPLTEGKVQEKGGTLSIENLTAQDGGNYTCKVITPANEIGKSTDHQLIIIDIPTYSINAHIVYNMTQHCNLTDVDIMSLYLPSGMKEALCGFKCKFCDVKVRKSHCTQVGEKGHMSLYLTVSLEPFKSILPSVRTRICDINCQMHVYSRVVNSVVKNVQNVETIPVVSKLSYRKVELYPTKVVKKKSETEVTEPVELVISCPAGFGLRKPERICAACQPNTYSAGDESYCTPCAVGEYQPVGGSKSCLSCTSPLQDPACLRIMYSNTKMFRIYVGIGFGTLVLIIVLVYCCSSAAKKSEKQIPLNDKHRKHYRSELSRGRRNRNPDVEQAIEPLLEGPRRSRRQNLVPPKPPPPDFF